MIYKYVDPYQNVYWFREDPSQHVVPTSFHYFGIVLKTRMRNEKDPINLWNVGDHITVSKTVCIEEEDSAVLAEILIQTR